VTIHLVSLDCPSCGSALEGEGLDTIFFCQHCGDAALLGEDGLEMIESTALVPAAGRSVRVWKPGWMIEADITVSQRTRAGGHPTDGWRGTRTYVVPAFEMRLTDLTRIMRGFAELGTELREVPRDPIHGGTLAMEDALTIIRHQLIGDEARRSDDLASVMVDIDVRSSRLVAMPWDSSQGKLTCSVTGVKVRERS
jgi:hypothetical protein